jgi:hypothetical protein
MTTVLLGLVLALQVAAEGDWEDSGTRKGTTLAFRDNQLLNAREVRGTSELPFAVGAIAPFVCDFQNYTKLLPDVREARLVDGMIPADYEIYLRYAPRFLVVAARDVVLRVRAEAGSEGRAGCSWLETEGRVEPRSGTVRMPLLRGSWTIERIDAERSRVTYQVAARPGGRIPAWLVRRGAVGALPDVLSRLRDELRKAQGVSEGALLDRQTPPDDHLSSVLVKWKSWYTTRPEVSTTSTLETSAVPTFIDRASARNRSAAWTTNSNVAEAPGATASTDRASTCPRRSSNVNCTSAFERKLVA